MDEHRYDPRQSAKDDASDADTFLNDPAQRAMFEESFKAGMEQGGEGMYEDILTWWDWGCSWKKSWAVRWT